MLFLIEEADEPQAAGRSGARRPGAPPPGLSQPITTGRTPMSPARLGEGVDDVAVHHVDVLSVHVFHKRPRVPFALIKAWGQSGMPHPQYSS